jgi:small subunit ribosomal protein S8e
MNTGRKITGGKYHSRRKRKLYEKPIETRITILGETRRKTLRTRGGHQKTILLSENIANVMTENGKSKRAEIKNVIETPQNRFFSRQNRLLKGAIIETSLGKAKITNRPTQEGQVNAVLVKEVKETK